MPSKSSKEHKQQLDEEVELQKKKSHHGKENSGGEASKHALAMSSEEKQQKDIDIGEGKDHKKGNIGPSGQGGHRGREARNRQSSASGRPDHSSASPGAPMGGH